MRIFKKIARKLFASTLFWLFLISASLFSMIHIFERFTQVGMNDLTGLFKYF